MAHPPSSSRRATFDNPCTFRVKVSKRSMVSPRQRTAKLYSAKTLLLTVTPGLARLGVLTASAFSHPIEWARIY
jgi:hypothetical protein